MVDQGATQAFRASVTGTTNTAVTWSIQEGPAGGSITSAGAYTAPSTAGTFHIVATSQADSSKSATAAITVPPVSVAVSPPATMVDQGATASFSANVSGTVINTSVTWSVQEGAAGGTVSSAGAYTAPLTAGVFHVVATSRADPTKSGVATTTVPAVSVSVSPMSDTLGPNGPRTFVATVSGTVVNTNVTWSIVEGTAGGSITNSGMYTAPTTTGTFHVVATDVADPSAGAEATVTVVSSGFAPTDNMETPRAGHTATLLPNGKVLIAGGTDGSSTLQSAEIFDPATNTFSATGNMTSARVNHTATLLANGKVLLSGGDQGSPGTVLATVELYDPATETFAATGPMVFARTLHTATLLANGKVLLSGGSGSSAPALATAELYDPATGIFTSTGSLAFARFNHAAALLANGKVLVMGGDLEPLAVLDSAELYDPALGTFSGTGANGSQDRFTLTLLPNQKVLAAGGFNVVGDCTTGCGEAPLSQAGLYDPSAGAFTAAINMVQAHGGHTATALSSGKLLIVGGETFTVELFDPTSGTLSLTGSLEIARTGHTATLLNDGRVLVTGGAANAIPLGTAEVYK